jgi:hypothetical protein
MDDREGLKRCLTCTRDTANLGGRCLKCLNSARDRANRCTHKPHPVPHDSNGNPHRASEGRGGRVIRKALEG